MGFFSRNNTTASGKVHPTEPWPSAPHAKQKQVRLCIVLTGDDNWVRMSTDYLHDVAVRDHFKEFFTWLETNPSPGTFGFNCPGAYYIFTRDQILYAFAEIVE